MSFQVGDQVVHPAFGVGRITDVVTRRFSEVEARPYYEIAIQQSTVWVAVADSATCGLRPLTARDDLDHYRAVLTSRPAALTADPRQRRTDLQGLLKGGSLQTLCEIVRDLTARSWLKPLGEADTAALRKAREGLCREWAAAEGISPAEAAEEIDRLLAESRKARRAV